MFFVFKQKTAYEMRISDWSSDVCSSDLSPSFPCTRHTADRSAPRGPRLSAARVRKPASRKQPRLCGRRRAAAQRHHLFLDYLRHHLCSHLLQQALCAGHAGPAGEYRCEEGRGGKEVAGTITIRWSPEH